MISSGNALHRLGDDPRKNFFAYLAVVVLRMYKVLPNCKRSSLTGSFRGFIKKTRTSNNAAFP